MSQSWMVTVEGQSYGPYPFEQMQAFIAEGRLVAHSLVTTPGEPAPHRADEDPGLVSLFRPARPRVSAVSEKLVPAEHATPQKFGRHADDGANEPSHFVIVADMKSHSINGLEEAIFNLGQTCPLVPQVWLLKANLSISAVRNTLVQKLGTLDTLFVVDTTHDKSAWFNFGPESESRIRRIWNKPAAERKSA